ncbi:MAG: hypothetical protein HYV97_18685 [Bdellovibrio sp.]|nr:hypothetical protein [Bdellovibrio sp.]
MMTQDCIGDLLRIFPERQAWTIQLDDARLIALTKVLIKSNTREGMMKKGFLAEALSVRVFEALDLDFERMKSRAPWDFEIYIGQQVYHVDIKHSSRLWCDVFFDDKYRKRESILLPTRIKGMTANIVTFETRRPFLPVSWPANGSWLI